MILNDADELCFSTIDNKGVYCNCFCIYFSYIFLDDKDGVVVNLNFFSTNFIFLLYALANGSASLDVLIPTARKLFKVKR